MNERDKDWLVENLALWMVGVPVALGLVVVLGLIIGSAVA